ncbi:Fe-S cluster assembly scaffold protein NifU [Chloroflexota bacterium]
MPVYNDTVMDHFMNPRNVGEIENPDGVGEEGNPVCGDMMTFYIKVKDNRLEDVKFKTFGCGAAIAVSSMVSEMAKGKTLEEAQKITPGSVAKELEGLPKNKLHCSNLGAQALNLAIKDYLNKGKTTEQTETETASASKSEDEKCVCPFCDKEIEDESLPYCKACKATISR